MTNEMTPADYAAITGNTNRGGGIFGDGNGAWWIVILFLFAFAGGGWGNGWGGGNAASMYGTLPGYSQSNDFSNLERENDIIRSDICTNFAAVNQALASGFQNIQTSFATAELARSNTQAALMQQLYTMSMANQQTASDNAMNVMQGFNGTQMAMMQGFNAQTAATTNGFAQTNYNLASQSCDLRNTIQNTTRDVIDSQTAGTNAILAALNQQNLEAKNERIAELQNQNNALRLAASQQAQNAYLVDQLRPSPIPAYQVANPYGGNYGCNCAGNYA